MPHDIALNDNNLAVQDAQAALLNAGMYPNLLLDGEYGKTMKEAVEALGSYLNDKGDEHAELFQSGDHLTIEAQRLLESGDLTGYVETVESGVNGTETRRVQSRLYSLFFLKRSGVDGYAGEGTATAIRAFQEKNGLEITGVADEPTQQKLFSSDAIGDWSPRRIEVSINEQRVRVYHLNEDNEYELEQTFICSTGYGSTTPRGVFRETTRPMDRWHYFVKWQCWAQYTYEIEGDILFHSVIFTAPNDKAVKMSTVYDLGSKASHGCVRLAVQDAKWIFENCEKGTTVVIY